MRTWVCFSSVLAGLCLSPALQAAPTTPIPSSPCHLPGHEGILRCLSVDVPLDYARPSKGTLKLHVVIAEAGREGIISDPLFVLAGGPGESGSSIAYALDIGFKKVRTTRDIVLIDQRGTGKSGKLSCPKLEQSETTDPDQGDKEVENCLRSLKVDFNDYSTEAAARDIEQVRLALNKKKINLWGGSYGTRLAQAYARLFPANVRSMVIDGVVSPLQNVADLSQETARALTLLRQQCQQSAECKAAFPQFELQLEALLARAAAKNTSIQFFHPRTGKKQQIPLSLASFGLSLQSMLYRPEMAGRLPWLVMQAAADNWQPFIANTFGGNGADGISIGLYLAVLCSEDIPYLTPAQMKIDPTMAGARWSQKILGYCPILKVAPRPRPATSIIQAPTLLLSGQRDPVTPPERGEEAMKYFSNGQHLIAQQAGHIVTMQPCAAKLLRQFLDAPDKKVDGKCLSELLAAPFVVSDYGTQP